MNQDLKGKAILITGATEGIGKAAAVNLAHRGASLTLIGRNREKTERVVSELKSQSGNGNIEYILCDLSRLSDVKKAAEIFKTKHDRLDILVNNAGATFPKLTKTVDGYEKTFALNHLAHFALTIELMDLIRKTPGARVVSTASRMERLGRIDLDTIATSLDRSGIRAYGDSKLANIVFTKELQRKLEGTTATANCFHPGVVKSKFGAQGEDFGFVTNFIYKLVMPFGITPEEGADTLIWLATSDEASKYKGGYFAKRRPIQPGKQALDANFTQEFWKLSERLVSQALQQ